MVPLDLIGGSALLPNKRLQRTNAATDCGIGASRRSGSLAFAAEAQRR